MSKVLWRTCADVCTIAQAIDAAFKGLSISIGSDNKFQYLPPAKFNPDWFPVTVSHTRPQSGHVCIVEGNVGIILYVADDEVHVKFKDGTQDAYDLDNFHHHTSRGRQTIWEI